MLPPIYRGAGHRQNNLAPIKLNVVEVFNQQSRCLLLTNLPVKTLLDAKFVVQSYKAEQIYLHSSRKAIQNLLTVINIAAYRTYWLINQAKDREKIKANCCFNPKEINALNIFLFKKLPKTRQNLKDIYYQIAILGGYKNKNNKHPPGILTIYRGIKKLDSITQMYEAML